MIHLSWQRSNATTANAGNQLPPTPLPVDMWWLPEASQIAVGNARKLIHFFAEAADDSRTVRVCILVSFVAFVLYMSVVLFLLYSRANILTRNSGPGILSVLLGKCVLLPRL